MDEFLADVHISKRDFDFLDEDLEVVGELGRL